MELLTRDRHRILVALLVAGLVGVPALPSSGDPLAPDGFRTAGVTELVRGVTAYRAFRGGTHAVNVAKIEPAGMVRFDGGVASGRIADGKRETTSAMCRRSNCLLAVNGDFYDPAHGRPYGAVIDDGVLLRTPRPAYPQLTITADGAWKLGELGWSGNIVAAPGSSTPEPDPLLPGLEPTPEPPPGATTVKLAGVNEVPQRHAVLLYTRHWNAHTPKAKGTTEIVVRLAGSVRPTQNQRVELKRIVDGNGNTAIARGHAVLAGTGDGAKALRRLWDASRRDGSTVTLRTKASIGDIQTSMGGGPLLVRDGKVQSFGSSGFADGRHPRTLVGTDAAGQRWLVTVDGRQRGYSEGMTLDEAARFMVDLGATEVLNFDGGGSSTFVRDGRATNRPSDGRERLVTNALMAIATGPRIVARPAPPPPAPAPAPLPEPEVEPLIEESEPVFEPPPTVDPASVPVFEQPVAFAALPEPEPVGRATLPAFASLVAAAALLSTSPWRPRLSLARVRRVPGPITKDETWHDDVFTGLGAP